MGRGKRGRGGAGRGDAGGGDAGRGGGGGGGAGRGGAGRGGAGRGGAGRGELGQSSPAQNPANLPRAGAGRGNAQPAYYSAAPQPTQSAWGTSRSAAASVAAPSPTHAPRGAPAPVPIPTQSAWVKPAPAPTHSAWGQRTSAAAPTHSAWGPSTSTAAQASAPTHSAWGQSTSTAAQASAPTHSAWGQSTSTAAQASAPTHSAWGPSTSTATQASAPTHSAWGQNTPAAARNQAAGPSASSLSRVAAENGSSEGSQNQPQQQRSKRREPVTYVGYNGKKAGDRGSIREKKRVCENFRITKQEGVTKQGTSGTPVPLTTNYFRVPKTPNWQLYQYRVDFSPPIEHKPFANKLIRDQKPNLGGYLFDGTMLFLSVKLHNNVTEFMAKDRDGDPIQITVKFVKQVSMVTSESIQILNLILRRTMAGLNLQLVGRSHFDTQERIDINEHALQLWPGYNTSIRQHETDILLCAEIAHKVMRMETLYDILQRILNDGRVVDYKQDFSDAVVGMTVLTQYNNKTYRIDDIDYDQTPSSTFVTNNGTMTFRDYYRNKYNINLTIENQPLLIARSRDRAIRGGEVDQVLLVPEICRATGFTDAMRRNYKLMESVAYHTRVDPGNRIAKLLRFNNRLRTTPDSSKILQDWNLGLDSKLVTVTGRELDNESIIFAGGRTLQTSDWSQAFRKNSMYLDIHLKNWVLILPLHKIEEARSFVGVLQKAAKGMRYEIANPHYIDIGNDNGRSYANAIESSLKRDPQLVMCILMNVFADKYSTIKKLCCVTAGVPSQVLLYKTITPKRGAPIDSLLSIATKVAIQLNAKLGGVPWTIHPRLQSLMVVGYDVCHDTKDKRRSYSALVATMDMATSGQYFSTVTAHKYGEELSNSFALDLKKALDAFRKLHSSYPQRIFIYRDGVGEGQTEYVLDHEIKNIETLLTATYQEQPVKFLFTVVSKRINTRFFRGNQNPRPGTVVDTIVTLPERHDFFLISPSVRNGTVSPTNYNVLANTSGLTSDRIQQFTYKMTHMYYNWTATLAVPAVCQYAHKLAFLVGNFIHQTPNSALEGRLYFL